MEKNPISFLQEHFMKMHMTPRYVMIENRNGTHINWFKIRVECGADYADGEGSSKKDAKLKAAVALLQKLGLSSSYAHCLPSIANGAVDSGVEVSNTPTTNDVTRPLKGNNSNAPNLNSFTNYVGSLQEIAQKKGIAVPVYTDKPSIGPAHIPLFTTVCRFQNMEEEASSSTKKEAKTLAAKKMFERVSSNTNRDCNVKEDLKSSLDTIDKGISELEIHSEQTNAMAESVDRALKLYLPLSRNTVSKKVNSQDKRSYNDYHTFLRDSFSDTVRVHVMDKLQDIIRACQNYQKTENSTTPMGLLKSVLKELNINVSEVNVIVSEKSSIFGLQLDTDPVISEIGHGDTKSGAALQSVLKMATTVSILIA